MRRHSWRRHNWRRVRALATLASVAALAVAACGNGNITPAPSVGPSTAPSATPAATATMTSPTTPCVRPTEPPTRGQSRPITVNGVKHILVRWFVGLGPGTTPAQITLQQTVVTDFNALQDQRTDGVEPILLSLEIVQNNTATSILEQEIQACNAPDLIGPVGLDGLAAFDGEFMDLTRLKGGSEFAVRGNYPQALLDTMRVGRAGALVGLPYAVSPSYIFYNKDLFDAAGLKYPPARVGNRYVMPDGASVPWNWDTVRNIAMTLSLDTSGRNATEPGFAPANQVQFGFELQSAEGRRLASAFGSGSFVGPDGRAQFPDAWRTGWSWYYNGIWRDHFIANDGVRRANVQAAGDVLSSGRTAMGLVSGCCATPDATQSNALKRWDIAVLPANAAGETTAPADIETFAIDLNSAVPDRAFEAMAYIMSRLDLLAACGSVPAAGDRLAFYRQYVDPPLAKAFPGNSIDWQVALDMESYAAVPNQAAELPNDARATADYGKAFSTLATTPGLDMNKVFSDVTASLQADFEVTR
jgi:multiple sugar transport system substrate-binding protein